MFTKFINWLSKNKKSSEIRTESIGQKIHKNKVGDSVHIFPLDLDTRNYAFVHNSKVYSIDLSNIRWEYWSIPTHDLLPDQIHLIQVADKIRKNPENFEKCVINNFKITKTQAMLSSMVFWYSRSSGCRLCGKLNYDENDMEMIRDNLFEYPENYHG